MDSDIWRIPASISSFPLSSMLNWSSGFTYSAHHSSETFSGSSETTFDSATSSLSLKSTAWWTDYPTQVFGNKKCGQDGHNMQLIYQQLISSFTQSCGIATLLLQCVGWGTSGISTTCHKIKTSFGLCDLDKAVLANSQKGLQQLMYNLKKGHQRV